MCVAPALIYQERIPASLHVCYACPTVQATRKSLVHIRILIIITPYHHQVLMFRYISLSRHTRVPRDLISDILRMVSCTHTACIRARARPEIWGRVVRSSFQFQCLRFHFFFPLGRAFYFGSHQGWMGSSVIVKTTVLFISKKNLNSVM